MNLNKQLQHTAFTQAAKLAQTATPVNRLEDALTSSDALENISLEVQELLQRLMPKAPARALRGEWLGHPLHPIAVHSPLGGWMIATALDVAPQTDTDEQRQQYENAADLALLLGTIGGLGAITTGWPEWEKARGQARRTGLLHGLLTETAFFLNVGSLVARKQGKRKLGKTLSGVGLGIAVAGGMLGGQLVYRHRMG